MGPAERASVLRRPGRLGSRGAVGTSPGACQARDKQRRAQTCSSCVRSRLQVAWWRTSRCSRDVSRKAGGVERVRVAASSFRTPTCAERCGHGPAKEWCRLSSYP